MAITRILQRGAELRSNVEVDFYQWGGGQSTIFNTGVKNTGAAAFWTRRITSGSANSYIQWFIIIICYHFQN